MTTYKRSLEGRFRAFLDGLEDAENIDNSLSEADLAYGQRADFLLDQRRIVLEVKSLQTDPEYKIAERLDLHRNRPDFPVFFWNANLDQMLPHLSDGEEVRRQIFHAVTRAVQGALEKADDQIQATKEALSLEDSCGVVVILNQEVGILAPDIVTAKANEMLLKTRNNVLRYTQIACVWIISESHVLIHKDGSEHSPLILLQGPTADTHADTGKYLRELQAKWAKFEGYPTLFRQELRNFDRLSFRKRTVAQKKDEKPAPVAHEIWRRAYMAQPYLESLSEGEFIEYAVQIITAMEPHFLVSGRKLARARVAHLMERWTHILQEAEHRCLDMKKIINRI